MKVILLKDVDRVGQAGDVVQVADGYARNFLIPKSQALMATDANRAKFETRRRQHEVVAERERRVAEELATKLSATSLTVQVKVGEGDRLYGSVTAQNIADLLKEQGVDVDRRKIELEEPIRTLDVYNVNVRLHADVMASVKIWVVKE